MAGNRMEGAPGAQSDAKAQHDSSSTLAFDAVRLRVEGPSGPMPATPARILEALREKIAKCRVMVNESGIASEMNPDGTMSVYRNLHKNLKGAWVLNIQNSGKDGGDLRFIVGRTRSTWVLLYDQSPESIYENPKFMSIDLKKRDVVVLENGKTMYLSRISRHELDALNGVAAVCCGKKPALKKDTLAPGHEDVPSYSDLAAKLRASGEVHSEDLLFDMKEFADGIRFITALQDASGNAHYYIVSGEEEHAFWLYVNADGGAPEGAIFKTTFRYMDDSCVLYREG
ncbi:hypothetical protein L0Y65_01370 [Candidatus Micrarchaeota archaeon]|nr:hypothetical protein [Candidatus Micrarchaeota archaeon]